MTTQWREIILTAGTPAEIPGLPGLRAESPPVSRSVRPPHQFNPVE
jgi:hypothetical protein